MGMQNIIAQAQRMQQEIMKKQEEIYKSSFVGESEWVRVTINGKKEVQKVEILYSGDLNDDKEMLSDMIAIAMKNAINSVNKEIEKKLGAYSSQLGGLM